MFLGLIILDLWAVGPTPVRRTTWHRDLNRWPCWWWSISAIRVFVLHLYTKFKVCRPFRSEDMTHFRSQQYVGLVTFTFVFDLETGAHYCPWGTWTTILPILCFQDVSFSIYRSTTVRRITWPCDPDLWPWRSRRSLLMRVFLWSSCSICVPSLNFVGIHVRKILGIYCVSINRPGDLDLLTSK